MLFQINKQLIIESLDQFLDDVNKAASHGTPGVHTFGDTVAKIKADHAGVIQHGHSIRLDNERTGNDPTEWSADRIRKRLYQPLQEASATGYDPEDIKRKLSALKLTPEQKARMTPSDVNHHFDLLQKEKEAVQKLGSYNKLGLKEDRTLSQAAQDAKFNRFNASQNRDSKGYRVANHKATIPLAGAVAGGATGMGLVDDESSWEIPAGIAGAVAGGVGGTMINKPNVIGRTIFNQASNQNSLYRKAFPRK